MFAAWTGAAAQDDPDDANPCPAGMFRQGDNGCLQKLDKPALPVPVTSAEARHLACNQRCSARVSRCVAACGTDSDCNNHCSDQRFFGCLARCRAASPPP